MTVPSLMSTDEWDAMEAEANEKVARAAKIAEQRPVADPAQVTRFVFSEEATLQEEGGQRNAGYAPPPRARRRNPKARAST